MELHIQTLSEEECLTTQQIVNKVKYDLLNGKSVVLGFSERFHNDYLKELKYSLNEYPEFEELLVPIIENDGGDIYFKLDEEKIVAEISLIDEFQYESNMSSYVNIDLELFNLFCNIMIDVAMFMTDNGNTLLSSI